MEFGIKNMPLLEIIIGIGLKALRCDLAQLGDVSCAGIIDRKRNGQLVVLPADKGKVLDHAIVHDDYCRGTVWLQLDETVP